jgi:hypothetical protein
MLAGGTPEGGQAKRPKQNWQLDYARATEEGVRVAVVSEDYPESRISKDNFMNIQRVIGRLVDELPDEGVHPQAGRFVLGKGGSHYGLPRLID